MKKHLAILSTLVALVLCLMVPVSADGKQYVADTTNGKMLTEAQQATLNEQATKIYEETGVEVVVMLSNKTFVEGEDVATYVKTMVSEGGYGSNAVVLSLFAYNDTTKQDNYYVYWYGSKVNNLVKDEVDNVITVDYSASSSYNDFVKTYLTHIGAMIAKINPTEAILPLVVDEADLLSASEESTLLSKLTEISNRQQCSLVVVTVNSLEGQEIEAYADDFYDYNGYGYGDDRSGIILLIDMESHDMHISTRGYGMYAMTDDGIKKTFNAFRPYLTAGDYADAFNEYASQCDELLTLAHNGTPYDAGDQKLTVGTAFMYAGIGGVIVGVIVLLIMGAGMKTAKKQYAAADYVREGSFDLTNRYDIFLYNTVTKTAKPKDNGGSSSHTSSSGATHGGGTSHF